MRPLDCCETPGSVPDRQAPAGATSSSGGRDDLVKGTAGRLVVSAEKPATALFELELCIDPCIAPNAGLAGEFLRQVKTLARPHQPLQGIGLRKFRAHQSRTISGRLVKFHCALALSE